MPLCELLDAVRDHLRRTLSPEPLLVGAAVPAVAAELPAVVLSVPSAHQVMVGVGRGSRSVRKGALQLRLDLDLAATSLSQTVTLSSDRRQLKLPHSPIVRADCSAMPLGDADLSVTLEGSPLVVTAEPPAAGQVRAEAPTGTLTFGAVLPSSGQMRISYHVGEWEVLLRRQQGVLQVGLYATTADKVDALSREVLAALQPERLSAVAGLASLVCSSVGAITPLENVTSSEGRARTRVTTFAFDFEREEPIVASSHVIRRVAVAIGLPGAPGVEHMDVIESAS